MKTFNTQVCTTREQSKRLLALGLKKETADMVYTNASLPYNKDVFHVICKEYQQLNKEVNYEISPFSFIPAWSLHRLLSIAVDTLDLPIIMFDIGKRMRDIGHFNCYEEIIQFIDDAIKEGYLNKEYLEE